jgi:purine nucleosidase
MFWLQHPRAKFAIECNSHARHALKVQTGEDGICLPDPVAMALALDPAIGRIGATTTSTLKRKRTDARHDGGRSPERGDDERNKAVWAPVIAARTIDKPRLYWTIDNRRWKQALYSALL